jgi:hypothetical protein
MIQFSWFIGPECLPRPAKSRSNETVVVHLDPVYELQVTSDPLKSVDALGKHLTDKKPAYILIMFPRSPTPKIQALVEISPSLELAIRRKKVITWGNPSPEFGGASGDNYTNPYSFLNELLSGHNALFVTDNRIQHYVQKLWTNLAAPPKVALRYV